MKKTVLISSLLISLLSINSYAEPNAYVFGTLGQAKYKGDGASESATSFGIGGGYWFNENFAIEGRYDDFGEVDLTEREGTSTFPSQTSASAFGFNLLGGVPVSEQFKLYAKIGVSFWDADISSSISIPEIDYRYSDSTSFSGNEFTYGFGAEFKATENFSIGAEYSSFAINDSKSISDDESYEVDGDISNFGISAKYNF